MSSKMVGDSIEGPSKYSPKNEPRVLSAAEAAKRSASINQAHGLASSTRDLLLLLLFPNAAFMLVLGLWSLFTTFDTTGAFDSFEVGVTAILFLIFAMLGVSGLWAQRQAILYTSIVSFLRVCINIFFKKVEVVGREYVPSHGPLIICGNHQNQFIDGAMLSTASGRRVRELIAAKSFAKPIIGHFASAMQCIPVVRPQDVAQRGTGKVTAVIDNGTTAATPSEVKRITIVGEGTQFLEEVHHGDKLAVGKDMVLAVESVVSDTLLYVKAGETVEALQACCTNTSFKIHPKMDHEEMYNSVFTALRDGGCVGIFPEGGSHDRPQLLPLKMGIALMALGAADKFPGLVGELKIVPCGLNYFRGHRFRSKAVVEYGPPFVVSADMVEAFRKNKKKAVDDFMTLLTAQLEAVTINVPDFRTLSFVHTARALYTPTNMVLPPAAIHKLNHRFALGAVHLEKEPKFIALRAEIEEYQNKRAELGLNENDIVHSDRSRAMLFPYFLSLAVLALLALIPGILLNLPVGLVLRYGSRREAEKALQGSSVKIQGKDVMASYKVITAMVLVPSWYLFCTVMLILFSGWPWSRIILAFLSMPLFSYLGVRFTEQGVLYSKKIRPLFLRLLPSGNVKQQALLAHRKVLQTRVRELVEEFGPRFDFFDDRIISKDELKARALQSDEIVMDDFNYDDMLGATADRA